VALAVTVAGVALDVAFAAVDEIDGVGATASCDAGGAIEARETEWEPMK
jgi:hypothetical protein